MSAQDRVSVREAEAGDLAALAALCGAPCAWPAAPAEHLFVACAPAIVGTLRLTGPVGLQRPRPWYHVGCAVHAAPELGLYHRQTTLLMGNDLTGASELTDFALDEAAGDERRRFAIAAALVAAARRAARDDAALHGPQLIAELPGVRDEAGRSPFWQGLGRHFYKGDPQAAAAQHGPAWRSHVAALLPRQVLYASFLPEAAQAAIGQVHPRARPWRQALDAAGWKASTCVRIDDAGPVLSIDVE